LKYSLFYQNAENRKIIIKLYFESNKKILNPKKKQKKKWKQNLESGNPAIIESSKKRGDAIKKCIVNITFLAKVEQATTG
jgi:hypothetical protein